MPPRFSPAPHILPLIQLVVGARPPASCQWFFPYDSFYSIFSSLCYVNFDFRLRLSSQVRGLLAARAFSCISKCGILPAKRPVVTLPEALTLSLPPSLPCSPAACPLSEPPASHEGLPPNVGLGAGPPKDATFAELNKVGDGHGGPDRLLPPPHLARRAQTEKYRETLAGPAKRSSGSSPAAVDSANEDQKGHEMYQQHREEGAISKGGKKTSEMVVRVLPPPATYASERLAVTAALRQQHAQCLQQTAAPKGILKLPTAASYTGKAGEPPIPKLAAAMPSTAVAETIMEGQEAKSMDIPDSTETTKKPKGRPPKKAKLQEHQPQPLQRPPQEQQQLQEHEWLREQQHVQEPLLQGQSKQQRGAAPSGSQTAACISSPKAPLAREVPVSAVPKKRGRPPGTGGPRRGAGGVKRGRAAPANTAAAAASAPQ